MTQSSCAGGLGGITLIDESGKPADDRAGLVLPASKSFSAFRAHPGLRDDRHGPFDRCRRAEGCLFGNAHGCCPSFAKMRSGVNGRWGKRTPVASASAFAIAGATGLIEPSPCAFAPSGPIVS